MPEVLGAFQAVTRLSPPIARPWTRRIGCEKSSARHRRGLRSEKGPVGAARWAARPHLPLLEPGGDEHEYHPEGVPNLAPGQMVELSLDSLIENIYVAPTAPPYFRKAVASVTAQYGLAREPVRSSLADDPVR
jgi:hypothetical protein